MAMALETRLYNLSQRMRLWARASVKLNQAGEIISGEIDKAIEADRLLIEEFIDQAMDGHVLNGLQLRWLEAVEAQVREHHLYIKQLALV